MAAEASSGFSRVAAGGQPPSPSASPIPANPPRRSRWRPLVLLAGLMALVGLGFLTVATGRAPVEADLSGRSNVELVRNGEAWAAVRFEGRDATLLGEALAEEARAKAREAIAGLFGVRTVRDATTLLPERRPFTFSAVKDGRNLALDGYVPTQSALQQILEAARATGANLSGQDRLMRARGAPPGDFAGMVTFALAQLAKLPSGRITLSDGAIVIEGRAADLSAYDALSHTMHGRLPDGMTLSRFEVRPPVASPFLFTAERDGAKLTLSGYVPSEEARAQVLSSLRRSVPGAAITDETRLADGAPSADLWLKAVNFAGQALAASPHSRVTLSDSSLFLEANAADYATYDTLTALRRTPPEGFQISRFAADPPRVSPFTWKLERSPERVVISGHTPSEEAKRLLSDAVRSAFPGVAVVDNMRLASGGPSPEAWAGAASFAVAQLAKLRTGTVDVTGTRVDLSGEAMDSASYGTIRQAAASPPGGVVADASAVRPPTISPYVFAVRRENDSLTVSGFYPDDAAHDALRTALERDFLGEKVTDVSAIGGGAPKGFLAAALAGLAQLSRLGTGEMRLSDGQLRLSGTTLQPGAAAEIQAELGRALKPPFTAEMALEPAPAQPEADAAQCQTALGDLLSRGTIQFDTGSQYIDKRSRGLLDRIAFALARCPGTHVEVAGHTDTDGDAARNQSLSQARAEAVVTYLAAAGVARDRLTATGYGATRPVAPNDTEAGKALNRRIEMVVREAQPQ